MCVGSIAVLFVFSTSKKQIINVCIIDVCIDKENLRSPSFKVVPHACIS